MRRMPSLVRAKGLFTAWLLAYTLLDLGCEQRGNLPPTHPASGKVVYSDGTPMKGGTIQFLSTSPDSTLVTSGEIDDDGRFTLYTLQNKTKAAGAVEGQYQVMILPRQGEDHKPVAPITLSESYTIKAGENTFPNITVPRAPR